MLTTITNGSATFTTRVNAPSDVILSVDGELDMTNISDFLDTAVLAAEDRTRVVIDLSGVTFFGTAGVSALHALGERYTAGDTPWAVVPSRNVDRVMRICDTDAVVPLKATVAAAFASM